MSEEKIRVAFLDRDGTINVDHGYVHRVEDFDFLPGAIEGMKLLQEAGFRLAIVTNQSGIARGMYSTEDVLALHDWLRMDLAANGVVVDAIEFCPHAPQDRCSCRKPEIGMTKQVEKTLGAIEYETSIVIGDKLSDFEFAQQLGAKSYIIRSSYWVPRDLRGKQPFCIGSLVDCANHFSPCK